MTSIPPFSARRNYASGAVKTALTVRSADNTPSFSFAQVFENITLSHADRPALWFEGREVGDIAFLLVLRAQITYGEVNRKANQVAHWAHQKGLKTHDVVALMMENRPEFIYVWLGLAKLVRASFSRSRAL